MRKSTGRAQLRAWQGCLRALVYCYIDLCAGVRADGVGRGSEEGLEGDWTLLTGEDRLPFTPHCHSEGEASGGLFSRGGNRLSEMQ